jgi:hypothetical protein
MFPLFQVAASPTQTVTGWLSTYQSETPSCQARETVSPSIRLSPTSSPHSSVVMPSHIRSQAPQKMCMRAKMFHRPVMVGRAAVSQE